MKILAIHQSADLYGSDRSFLTALQALKNQNSEISVILPKEGPLSKEIINLDIDISYIEKGYLRKSVLKKPFNFLLDSIKTACDFRNKYKNYDVVYINTVVCFSAMLALIFLRKKKYIHVREIPTGFLMFFFRILLKMTSAKLIFNSIATKNAFQLDGEVIYNGVEYQEKTICIRNNDFKLRLLIVGRINSWKGHALLLEALGKVNNPIHLKIVGNTIPGQENLEKALIDFAKKNLACKGHSIEFCGFSENVSKYYEWCDYLVVPSIQPEPFGRVAIEALSFGKPVIGSHAGGLVEIIKDDINGYTFEMGSVKSLVRIIEKLETVESKKYLELSSSSIVIFKNKFSESQYSSNIRSTLLNG